mmetsp:Transcript_2736/g.4179  ORF Transcript_2736/g.4179 Transcript_2736/m.4179 type:complete len:136 (+) Transcript_2736:299-706(+)
MLNELKLFRSMAHEVGVVVERTEASFTTRAYVDFLISTADSASFEESFLVMWALERAYSDGWQYVKDTLNGHSKWAKFIDNWTSQGFKDFVSASGRLADDLASNLSAAHQERLQAAFVRTLQFEHRFFNKVEELD